MRRIGTTRVGRRIRSACSVPNVLATLALAAALSGTAYAAVMVTGTNVKNESLLSGDFKNLSLASGDFSATTRTQVAVHGDLGPTGDPGEQGSQGAKGSKGAAGEPAPRAFTFQSKTRNTRIGGANPNPLASDLSNLSCQDVVDAGDTMIGCVGNVGTPIRFPRWNYWCTYLGYAANKHCKTTNIAVDQMTRTFLTVLKTADNPNGGLLDMPYSGTIILNASATFFTQRTAANERVECQLQIARVENGVTGAAINVGVPIVQYRTISHTDLNQQERLLNVGITGAIEQPAGVFETWLACRNPDDDLNQHNRPEFIEGNMSVLSTRTNGEA